MVLSLTSLLLLVVIMVPLLNEDWSASQAYPASGATHPATVPGCVAPEAGYAWLADQSSFRRGTIMTTSSSSDVSESTIKNRKVTSWQANRSASGPGAHGSYMFH